MTDIEKNLQGRLRLQKFFISDSSFQVIKYVISWRVYQILEETDAL